jgi:hypothetical protein
MIGVKKLDLFAGITGGEKNSEVMNHAIVGL